MSRLLSHSWFILRGQETGTGHVWNCLVLAGICPIIWYKISAWGGRCQGIATTRKSRSGIQSLTGDLRFTGRTLLCNTGRIRVRGGQVLFHPVCALPNLSFTWDIKKIVDATLPSVYAAQDNPDKWLWEPNCGMSHLRCFQVELGQPLDLMPPWWCCPFEPTIGGISELVRET